MNVLLAYDGSETAEAALLDLPRAGLPPGSSIGVLSVDEPSDPIIDFDVTTLTHHHRRSFEPLKIARMAEETLSLILPGTTITARSAVGSAAESIVGIAAAEQADLVVLGSGSDGPLARLHLGSTSSHVVQRSRQSVRVGRNPHQRRAPAVARIVVGIDGSPAARAAANALRGRCFPHGSEIWLATALDGGMDDPEYREQSLGAAAMHQLYTARLTTSRTSVRSEIRVGDAVGVLLSIAEEIDADAIFVGASGRGGLFTRLLGSTACTIAERAECSVEVVRPAIEGSRREMK